MRRLAARTAAPAVGPGSAFAASFVLALVLALLAGLPAWARAANYELRIEAPDELEEPLRTRTLIGRWVDEPDFDRRQLPLFVERAREEALAIAQAAGYFSATVDVRTDATQAGLPVVTLAVQAGARTTVNRFTFSLEGPAAEADVREELVARWPLPEGSFFRSSAWEQGKRLIVDALQQRGYVRARIVESLAEVDPQKTVAGLTVRADSGPRLAFGEMSVQGLERYDREIVEALAPWAEAPQPYELDALLTFQARLRASGYFDSVDVLPDFAAVQADPQRSTVPVRVQVSERRTQRTTFGIGYSSDEGARGLLGYEHRNVFGRGWQLDSGLLVQSVRRRLFASLRTPQKASGHYYQGGGRVERLDVQGELTDKQTVFIGEGKRDESVDRFLSLQYQTEERELPLRRATEGTRALTLGYAWNQRRVDSPIDPRAGYTISAQVSGASSAILSDRSFVRVHARGLRFWPMPADTALEGGLLIGLLELGQVFASGRDGIPSENLFRTGGTSTVRGYQFLSLGVPEAGAIVGGRVLAVGSLEYQHPVARDWYGAVFLDAGHAADRWSDYDAAAGYGFGARWRSPVGPVSVDLAYGEAVRSWRLHLSVGYAF